VVACTAMSQKHQWNWSVVNSPRRRAARCFFGAVALACTLAGARVASAQHRFGDKGQLAISGENLFGISTETVKVDQPGGKTSDTFNHASFLLGAQGDPALDGPRVGVHYFVIPNLSIGGTIGFDSRGGTATRPIGMGVERTTDREDSTTLFIMPKVGYTLMFSDMFGFWFRGGIGYAHNTVTDPVNTNNRSKASFWLMSLDAPFVMSPVPHFAFYAGPGLEFSFAGTFSDTNGMGVTTSVGASYFHLNLAAGLIGYFDL
jgi:hypothetical protein